MTRKKDGKSCSFYWSSPIFGLRRLHVGQYWFMELEDGTIGALGRTLLPDFINLLFI